MSLFARRPGCRLALLLGLCGCPEDHAPTQTTTSPDQLGPTSGTDPATPTTSATDTSTSAATPTTGTTSSTGTDTTYGSSDAPASTGEQSTSTTEPSADPEDCGDGQLQPGEQCDLGLVENVDTGDCTSKCRLPSCGDGHVWAGHETCDNADANNDTTWNGCRTDCTPGPSCGDAILQPDHEECDDGPEWNGSGESKVLNHAPCTAQCRLSGRIFFITSTTHSGDLDGLAGADEICRTAALNATLDNHLNFVAWLSDAGASPKTRIPHGPDVAEPSFVMPDGTIVADDWDDLITNGPRLGVYIDEFGQSHEADPFAWTNTLGDGGAYTTAQVNHCLGWASALPNHTALYGIGVVPADIWMDWQENKRWTNNETKQCHKLRRLFCVEK